MFSFIGQFLTLNEIAVMAMFGTFIWMLFRGIPVAMSLVGVSLVFVLIAEFFLDPFRGTFRDIIEFDRTGIEYQKLQALSGRLFGNIVKTQHPGRIRLDQPILLGFKLQQLGFVRLQHTFERIAIVHLPVLVPLQRKAQLSRIQQDFPYPLPHGRIHILHPKLWEFTKISKLLR